jgi:hypothetical protein
MKIVRRILWVDGTLLVVALLVLVSPALFAQSVSDVLRSTGLAADQVADIARSTDGVLKLALWAVILLVMLLGATIVYLMRIMTQIAGALERLGHRPCLASPEEIAEAKRLGLVGSLIPR